MDGSTATAPPAGAPPAEPEDDGLGAPPAGEQQEPETPAEPPAEPAGEGPAAELPDDGLEEDGEQIPALFLTGDYEVGTKVKGRKPDSTVLKLKGGKIDLQGQFNREDRLLILATVQVTGDAQNDTIVKETGEVKSTSQAQSATICGVSRLEDFLRLKLEGHPEILDVVLKHLDLGEE